MSTGQYVCNCGKVFSESMERTAHMATCGSRKEATKLCWHCNRLFRGNNKYEVGISDGHLPRRTVWVHKQCQEEMMDISHLGSRRRTE